MNHLFNFNVFGRWLKLTLLSFWICLPLLLFGQTDFIMDLNPVVSTDLGMSEVTFATNSLNELATDEYVYVAIHGKGSTFGTFSNANSKWTALKTPDVAAWIAANVPPTKTIVLLSSANQTATLQLVKKLAPLDKNLDRKLISWDEDVLLYEQGHIRGYGQCREYQFNGKVRTLYKGEIPKGKKFVAGKKCINLSNSRNLVSDWVEEWGQDAIQTAKKASNEGGDMLNSLTLLSASNLLPEAFNKIVEASSQKKMLKDCFEDYAAVEGHQLPADLVEKRLAIIWNSEKKLAEAMAAGTHSLIPDLIWKEIRSLLTTTDAKYDFDPTKEGEIPLNGIRGKFSETINSILGMGVKDAATANVVSLDWKMLLKITENKTGLITVQASRGSIFEIWVREAWAKRNLFNSKQSNGGKLTFYFSSPRTPIAAATGTSYKRVIDCSYTEKNTTPEDIKANRCEIVGVELKHTTGVLSGEPLQQFEDNVKLVQKGKLRRIEYIFSTIDAARANEAIFTLRNNGFTLREQGIAFNVFCINSSGIKTPVIFK